MQSAAVSDPEESKDSSTRNLYAAHIVRQGLNKEGWKLVVTGAALTVFVVSHTTPASAISQSECCMGTVHSKLPIPRDKFCIGSLGPESCCVLESPVSSFVLSARLLECLPRSLSSQDAAMLRAVCCIMQGTVWVQELLRL